MKILRSLNPVQFKITNPGAGLREFLEEVALVSNVDRWDNKRGACAMWE